MQLLVAEGVARIKALNGDYVTLYPWTFIKASSGAWSIANPGELNTSTMDDTDLAWAVQQAHAQGIQVHWMNQIQGTLDSSIPPGTQENLDKFFAAFEPDMLERAEFLRSIGMDVISVSCICFTYLEAPSPPTTKAKWQPFPCGRTSAQLKCRRSRRRS